MFKISFIVNAKKLAGVLQAIAGQVYDLEVVPVANAFVNGGAVKAKHENGRGDISQLELPAKGSRLRSKDIGPLLPSIGWSPGSFSHALNKLMEAKRIKRLSAGHYQVL